MKTMILVPVLALLLTASCTGPAPGPGSEPRIAAMEERIKSLENEVAVLHEADTAARLLMRRTVDLGHFNDAPWDNFFNEDEFWENTYYVHPFECEIQCFKRPRSDARNCKKLPEAERRACRDRVIAEMVQCYMICHPTPGGGVPGGGGGLP